MPIFAQMTDSLSLMPTLASVLTLGAMSPVVINLLVGLFLVVSIAMILLVLIQRPQGGGLSGAFGAGGSSGGAGQTAFGTKTGDVLTYATIGIFVCFLGFAIVLNFATRPPKPETAEPTISLPAGLIEESADSSTDDPAAEPADLSGDPDGAIEDAAEDVIDDAADAIENIPEKPTELPVDLPADDG